MYCLLTAYLRYNIEYIMMTLHWLYNFNNIMTFALIKLHNTHPNPQHFLFFVSNFRILLLVQIYLDCLNLMELKKNLHIRSKSYWLILFPFALSLLFNRHRYLVLTSFNATARPTPRNLFSSQYPNVRLAQRTAQFPSQLQILLHTHRFHGSHRPQIANRTILLSFPWTK